MLRSSLFLGLCALATLVSSVLGWTVTVSGNNYIVDTSGGLIFTVDHTTGDITSMLYNGIEAQDQSGKHSQISSGIGATCTYEFTGNDDHYVVIACTTSTLVHYYVAKYKDPAIHMVTYTTAEPSVGELRYIFRLNSATLPNGYTQSAICDDAIEGSDVFYCDGQTRSKFYSSQRFIYDKVHGVTGSNIGAYIILSQYAYEKSSGGPFFRDINNQHGDQNELYFFQNSGHVQTEAYRQGLHGPYTLYFTTGAVPSTDIDLTFWEGLGISAYTPLASRGYVSGKAIGIDLTSFNATVAFNNSANQYWVQADSSTGNFYTTGMIPGTYAMILYKNELAVAESSVTVTAGSTTSKNIDSAEDAPSTVIWQIGDFDGQPRGFLNADMIETMHPSDSRMHDWVRTYTVGQEDIGYFPMAIFKDVGVVTIRFALASGQGGARTLDIGTTWSFAGGRPQVTVNGWTGPTPAAPTNLDSRGVTRGTWRGNNVLYTVDIPDGTLYTGSTVNVITINVVSGSSGDTYLSPNIVFDAIRLY
ncbi:polysaccharide lyase family 4 protein [Stereum hirsutum FP-91666 SS1]|uniref:polysaccharide lyase family 4 protein n=1 Tax=Stereum hirsutum (strain FP-91666) TaxID=721885 RepID=UPI000444977F|nr:polysaccharide lyase family 4 protein [Stereum hirsutum FP-91666 SS1]EIM82884.1 polysaccharide lyase family 4 protein [Stereum hirsutum FP-91666 SS1]